MCGACGKFQDLRYGICFSCATAAEERLACRWVVGHLWNAAVHAARGGFRVALIDLRMAWARLWRVGDYKRGGYFDRQGYRWR